MEGAGLTENAAVTYSAEGGEVTVGANQDLNHAHPFSS